MYFALLKAQLFERKLMIGLVVASYLLWLIGLLSAQGSEMGYPNWAILGLCLNLTVEKLVGGTSILQTLAFSPRQWAQSRFLAIALAVVTMAVAYLPALFVMRVDPLLDLVLSIWLITAFITKQWLEDSLGKVGAWLGFIVLMMSGVFYNIPSQQGLPIVLLLLPLISMGYFVHSLRRKTLPGEYW